MFYCETASNYELVLEEEYEDDEKSKESQRIEKEAKQSLVKSKQQHNKVVVKCISQLN